MSILKKVSQARSIHGIHGDTRDEGRASLLFGFRYYYCMYIFFLCSKYPTDTYALPSSAGRVRAVSVVAVALIVKARHFSRFPPHLSLGLIAIQNHV